MRLLTARELEVLTLVSQGMTNQAIADHLQLFERTVRNHMTTVMQKLDANNRTHAVVIALQQEWIRLERMRYPRLPIRFYDLSIRSR